MHGIDALRRRMIGGLAVELMNGLEAALYQEAQEIIARAQEELVPVRNRGGGTLRGSAFVEKPEREGDVVRVVLGFGGGAVKYAAAVHENPRSGKTGGVSPTGRRYRSWAEVGEWHYLSRPLEEAKAGLDGRIGARVMAHLRNTV